MQYLMLNKTDQEHVLSELQAMADFLEASFKTVCSRLRCQGRVRRSLPSSIAGTWRTWNARDRPCESAGFGRKAILGCPTSPAPGSPESGITSRSRSPRVFRRSEMRGSRILQSFGRLMVGIGCALGSKMVSV